MSTISNTHLVSMGLLHDLTQSNPKVDTIDSAEQPKIAHIMGTEGDDEIRVSKIGDDLYRVSVTDPEGVTQTYEMNGEELASTKIIGGKGNDTITVDWNVAIAVTLYGGLGDDTLQGGSGLDRIYGGPGNDVAYGGEGGARIKGAVGGTFGFATPPLKEILGTDSDDEIYIEKIGYDLYAVTVTNRYGYEERYEVHGEQLEQIDINGGAGNDRITAASNVDVNLRLFGGAGYDTITGGQGNDYLHGGSDGDRLEGGAGHDTIYGGNGRNHLIGGSGSDIIRGGDDSDRIEGGEGDDDIRGGAGDDSIRGDDGHDLIDGGPGDDRLKGGKGRDVLLGGSGNDVLLGGAGNDRIDGGSGDDSVLPGAEGDDDISNITPPPETSTRAELLDYYYTINPGYVAV